MSEYPDGIYLWQHNEQAQGTPLLVVDNQAHVPVKFSFSAPSELIQDGIVIRTLTLLIPATEVVYQALTIYAILCGVDECRIEAAELLDRIKAARDAA